MTEKYVSSLLSNMGWGTGFRLPISNAKNKLLEKQLDKMQKKNLHLRISKDEEEKRVQNMEIELQGLTVVLSKNTKIAETEKASVQHEKTMFLLRNKHLSRLKSDYKKYKKQLIEHQERKAKIEKELLKRSQIVENISNSLKYNDETLKMLKESTKDKEKDIEFIQNYADLDQKEAEAINVRTKNLLEENLVLKLELDNIISSTYMTKQQFERIIRTFRRVHKERNDAIKQWKEVVQSLTVRDDNMKKIADDYISIRGKLTIKNYEIDDQKFLVTNMSKNHLDLKLDIDQLDRTVQEKRSIIGEKKHKLENYTNSSITFKTIIAQTIRGMQGFTDSIKVTKDKLFKLEQTQEKLSNEVNLLRDYQNAIKSDASSTDEKMKLMLKMIDNEEAQEAKVQIELDKYRKFLWEATNNISLCKKQLVTITYEIKHRRSDFISLKNQCKAEEIAVEKQRHEYYRLELILLHLESRLSYLLRPEEGGRSNQFSEVDEKTNRIIQLKKELFHAINHKRFLVNQKNYLWDIVEKCNREINEALNQKEELDTILKTNLIIARNYDADMKSSLKKSKNLKVQHSIFSFEKSKLTKALRENKEEIFSMEQYRANVQLEARIRIDHIKTHQNLLNMHKRTLAESNSKTCLAVKEVLAAIKRWKIKYEYNMYTHESSAESEAYLILKHAQEKELIKEEGHTWDQRVKEAEKEVLGLQNTLSLMITSNCSFRESLAPALKGTRESESLIQLQKSQRQSFIRKKKAETNLSLITQQYFGREGKVQEMNNWINELENILADRRFELNSAMVDIANQKNKIRRANILCRRIMRKLENRNDVEKRLIEAELKCRCTKEKYDFAVKTLGRSITLNAQLQQPVFELLQQYGIFSKLNKQLKQLVSSSNIPGEQLKKPEVGGQILKSPETETIYDPFLPASSRSLRTSQTAASLQTLTDKIETFKVMKRGVKSKSKLERAETMERLTEFGTEVRRAQSPTGIAKTIAHVREEIIMEPKVPVPISTKHSADVHHQEI